MKAKEKSTRGKEPILVQEEAEPVDRSEKMGYFLRKVEDRVVGMIDSQSLKMPSQKTPFVTVQVDEGKDFSKRLKKIQESKEKMQYRLSEVAEKERKLLVLQRTKLDGREKEREMSPLQPKVKSELSEKDITLLKRLKHEQMKFQRSLDEKTKAYEQKKKDLNREEEELKVKHRKEETETRKKEIAHKMQNIAKLRTDREKRFDEEKLRMVEVKTKKKLFEELDKKQKETDKSEMEGKVTAMEERIRNREVDLRGLRDHDDKYLGLKQQQKEQRQRKREEQDDLVQSRRMNLDKSKFYTLVVDESRKRKEESEFKEKERKTLVSAAREYSENVMRDHAPRLKTKSSEKDKDEEKAEGKSYEEIKFVGNSYFEYMRKLPKKPKKNNMNSQGEIQQSKNLSEPLQTLSTKYRDYLSERRMGGNTMSRTKDTQKGRNRGMWQEVEQACKMTSSSAREQGLQKLKFIASKLEMQSGVEDNQMLDKISAKLRILQTLAGP